MDAGTQYQPPDFAYIELTPEGPPSTSGRVGRLYQDEFSIFLVQVVSESEAGRALLVDPIPFLRDNIDELRDRLAVKDVRASVFRVNAEISANPKHRSEVWVAYKGSTNAIGLQYKYNRDMTKQGEQS